MRIEVINHPATYSKIILESIYKEVSEQKLILDPFAGTGKIYKIKELGFKGRIFCNELEREWADSENPNIDRWFFGDARKLKIRSRSIPCIVTSPTYGNRMADKYRGDGSKRFTYRVSLGRDLSTGNTGMYFFGDAYKLIHEEAYREFYRVMCYTGLIVINVKDFIKNGKIIRVTDWHEKALTLAGFDIKKKIKNREFRDAFW